MIFLKAVKRFFVISKILAKYEIDMLTGNRLLYFSCLRLLQRSNKKNIQELTTQEKAFECVNELGPIFVKLGQLASSRVDILPGEIIAGLSKLTDSTTPIEFSKIKKIIQDDANFQIDEIFDSIEEESIGSASIAQVHKAILKNGDTVVVKVIRPGIEKKIKLDLNIAKFLAKILAISFSSLRKLKLIDFVSEYEKSILRELDLNREAVNAAQLKNNLNKIKNIYIPKVHFELSSKKVLIMEYINGISINNIHKLKENNINLKKIASTAIQLLFESAFKDGIFHADMHPGNLLVIPNNDGTAKLALIDFGITGNLSKKDQRYLAGNFSALFNRDYDEVARLHIKSGWLDTDTNLDDFANEIRVMWEPLIATPLDKISFADMLLKLIKTAHSFSINLQPQFLLLQKTIYNIEGICRQLSPQINLIDISKPIMNDWMKTKVNYKKICNEIRGKLPIWLEEFPNMPEELLEFVATFKEYNLSRKDKSKPKQSNLLKKCIGATLILTGTMYFAASLLNLWLNIGVDYLALISILTGLLVMITI